VCGQDRRPVTVRWMHAFLCVAVNDPDR